MHIIVDREPLREAVNLVSKAVSSRTTLPILTGIKLVAAPDQLILTGSDADMTIQVTVAQQNDDTEWLKVVKLGSIVLPARYFTEIVRKLPTPEIELEVLDNMVTNIRSGRAEFNLNSLPADEYPPLPQLVGEQGFSMPAQRLKSLLRQTTFAASTLESRPVLTGVLFKLEEGHLTLVATDSHRLARRTVPVEVAEEVRFEPIIVPGRSLHELQRLLEGHSAAVEIVATDNRLLVKAGQVLFYSRLLEGTYPDTDRIIPSATKTTLKVDTQELLAAIDRALLLARDGKHVVKLITQTDHLQITSTAPEVGQVLEHVPLAHLEGEEVQIAFNAKFMLDALRVIEAEQLTIHFTGALSPFILQPSADEQLLHLILPVRTY